VLPIPWAETPVAACAATAEKQHAQVTESEVTVAPDLSLHELPSFTMLDTLIRIGEDMWLDEEHTSEAVAAHGAGACWHMLQAAVADGALPPARQ
jgi:hypothetical protein